MPETTKHGPSEAPDPRRLAEIEGIQIAEWCPTPDGTGPAEQVHMVIRVKGDALTEHRRSVFGKRPGRG